jgi:thiol-disulfide isomerase/thioredoxin
VRLSLLVVVAACSPAKDTPAPQAKPAAPPAPAPSPLSATTGPVTLLAADGAPMKPGVNIQALGKTVRWVIDGEPTHGFAFAYDENANGDLRDDPQRRFTKVGDVWELSFAMKLEAPDSGEMLDVPMRIRMRAGELRLQKAIERRGTITLPKGPMQFALIGDSGQFGLDHQYIAFDLDRDGHLDTDTLDNPELFHIFEKSLTLDDTSYTFELAADGSVLTLRPMKDRLPPRAPLTTGTPAPELSITDLDGKPATLSSLRGKVVLLDFWSTTCAPCIRALPHVAELRATLHDRGFEVMALADAQDGVRETLVANRSGIEAQDDAAQAVYRVDRFPMYFLVGRDGTILCSRCQLDTLEPMIEPALN